MFTERHSLLHVFALVRKWRKPVLLSCLAAFVISVIVALLLPNVYKSTAIFIPAALRDVTPERMMREDESMDYSHSPADADRILSIGNSQVLALKIIRQFNLAKRYQVDSAHRQQLIEEFQSNYNIIQNEREAIEVTFYDKDPEMASRIANAIMTEIEQIDGELTRENRKKVLSIYETRYNYLSDRYRTVRDSLFKMRTKYNVYHHERQSREFARAITNAESDMREAEGELAIYSKSLPAGYPKIVELKATINGAQATLNGLLKSSGGNTMNLEDFSKGTDMVFELQNEHQDLIADFGKAATAYHNAKIALEGKVSTIYVVQKALPATTKVRPVRWLIVFSSTVLTFFAGLVFITLYELYRREMKMVS